MKIILTRHGETVENIKGISQGQTPGTLSKRGVEQAKMLAIRLKDEKIDYIYSSDLGRAVDTVKEVAKYHPHLKVNFTKLLRERDIKEFAGKPGNKIDWYDNTGRIETADQMEKRAKKFIDKAYESHKKETILVLAHGGINAAILAVITGSSYADVFLMEDWHNTNVTVLEIYEDKSHKIHCMNCTRHLS